MAVVVQLLCKPIAAVAQAQDVAWMLLLSFVSVIVSCFYHDEVLDAYTTYTNAAWWLGYVCFAGNGTERA